MNLLIVLDETCFFHPDFLDKLINKLDKCYNQKKILIGIVNKVPKKNNTNLAIIRYFYLFPFDQIFRLSIIYLFRNLMNIIFQSGYKKTNFSVKGVCNKYKLKSFDINQNINQDIYIQKIKKFKPEILISSKSLIFGKKLLSLPGIIFLNRHTSLLPSYGGPWPVLRAIINNEKKIGVTVHLMTHQIDAGEIVSQNIYSIKNKSLFSIYSETFELSAFTVFQAIKKIKSSKLQTIKNDFKKTYYGMPSKKDIKSFLDKGGKLI